MGDEKDGVLRYIKDRSRSVNKHNRSVPADSRHGTTVTEQV